MSKLVDPIRLLQEKAAASKSAELAAEAPSTPYEVPLVPPLGAKLMRLTVASGYRNPIPVMFDPETRTTYPLPAEV